MARHLAALLLAAVVLIATPVAFARRAHFKELSGEVTRVMHMSSADGGSNLSATVYMRLRGQRLLIKMDVEGAAPNLPHAQHIHGSLDPEFEPFCPTLDAQDENGLIDAREAGPAYGGILVSLTTRGDFSASSALDVPRYPVADAEGRYSYRRNFLVSSELADALERVHVLIHGIDLNGDGVYDFENGPSSLDGNLPLEATIPAGCGKMKLEGRPRRAKKVEWNITPIPHSPAADGGSQTTGTMSIKARGNRLFIEMNVEGAAPNLPHAQHLHGSLRAGAKSTCPTASARNLITNDDLISVAEGAPAYGGLLLSLTTEGDMSPSSALDVSRVPVADSEGRYTYKRIVRVSEDIIDQLEDLTVIVHGIDLDNSGAYDGDAPSSIDDNLPLEITIPAGCGESTIKRRSKQLLVNFDAIPHDTEADGGSTVTGTARLTLVNTKLTISMDVFGASPNLPHAQHIHGSLEPGAMSMCPGQDARDDLTDDGLISVAEGAPSYGGILLALTTSGDSSPSSGLAVDRMPIADADGYYHYERTFTISEAMAENIEDVSVIVHGIDIDRNGIYDGAAQSSINPNLPLEITLPAACGEVFFDDVNRRYKTLDMSLSRVPHDPQSDGMSNVGGKINLKLKGNRLRIEMTVTGAAPNLPHAQHLHGFLAPGTTSVCPTEIFRNAITDDGLISVIEGSSSYGPILLALTTSGDTSPSSALALDRFPVASADGSYTYRRVFRVSDMIAERLEDLIVIIHGIDIDGSGAYDGDARSSLSESIPLELTVPAACAELVFDQV